MNSFTTHNLDANFDLLRGAKEEEISISQALEDTLAGSWLTENKDAIASYNEHIERDGIFGSRTRRF